MKAEEVEERPASEERNPEKGVERQVGHELPHVVGIGNPEKGVERSRTPPFAPLNRVRIPKRELKDTEGGASMSETKNPEKGVERAVALERSQ